jgi:hypothetical protein
LQWELRLLSQYPDSKTLKQRFKQDCQRLYQQVDEWVQEPMEQDFSMTEMKEEFIKEEPIEYEAVIETMPSPQPLLSIPKPLSSKPVLSPQEMFKIQVNFWQFSSFLARSNDRIEACPIEHCD